MDQIVCYSRSGEFRALCGGIRGFSHVAADTTADLASRLVEEPDVLCAILHFPSMDTWTGRFLGSLKTAFPLLHVVLVVEDGTGEPTFRGDPTSPEAFGRIEAHVQALERKDKRRRQRFDWPLLGKLRLGDAPELSLRVRAISASGAFLEASGPSPVPGSRGFISVQFKDFAILSGCEVLPTRPPAGNLPAGFGVRFTDLTPASQKVIDSIVQDELIRSLIEPGSTPRGPAIIS
jgi:hypothetical protein